MGILKLSRHYFAVLLLTLFSVTALGQSYLISEGNSFVDAVARQKRLGIEIEFKGLSDTQIVELIHKHYPEAKMSGTILEGLNFETSIGKIRIVIEGQAYKFENDPVKFREQQQRDIVEAPREIVFPPVTFEEIPRMHELIAELKSKGAVGTTSTNAVSIQVNMEMRQLTNRQNVKYLLDLMRNYYNSEHREHVTRSFEVPSNRTPYILDPSPGMMRKLNDTTYNPTPREFYDDFMYRQSLEFLGHRDAWTMEISAARRLLLSRNGEDAVVPRVMKMNKVRVSSLLLMAFPEDPLTKRVIESRWARPMPVAEFREFNNDFDLLSKVRWSLGATRAAELFGAYSHDRLFATLTGVSVTDIQRLRRATRERENVPVRYVLQSPEQDPLSSQDREWLRRHNPGVLQIQLSPERIGAIPLVLGNGTVVWHRRNIHRATLLGAMNPGLENALLQQALENKLVEALTFNRYAPGSFPETIPLSSVRGTMDAGVLDLVKRLNERFPEGWVLKGAWDLSSEKIIVTDKINFQEAMKAYRQGFESYKNQIIKRHAGADPETVIHYLKKHPGYLGHKIMTLLENRELLLVQQRRELVEEFRVEMLGGKVLGQGSTIPRFAYLNRGAAKPHPVFFAQAESFAQKVIDQLPAELRVLPYAFDVALTKQGDWILIETNPGGNSSFLEENPRSSRALVEYLRNYQPPREGLLPPLDQMDWIRRHLADFNLKAAKMYPGINLGVDSFEDTAFQRQNARLDLLRISREVVNDALSRGAKLRCNRVFLQ